MALVANILYAFVATCLLVNLLLALPSSGYTFTAPHLILALLCTGAVLIDYLKKRLWSLVLSCVLILGLPATVWFAATRWPGGDDGGGLWWFFGVGGTSVVAIFLGLPMIVLAHQSRVENA